MRETGPPMLPRLPLPRNVSPLCVCVCAFQFTSGTKRLFYQLSFTMETHHHSNTYIVHGHISLSLSLSLSLFHHNIMHVQHYTDRSFRQKYHKGGAFMLHLHDNQLFQGEGDSIMHTQAPVIYRTWFFQRQLLENRSSSTWLVRWLILWV